MTRVEIQLKLNIALELHHQGPQASKPSPAAVKFLKKLAELGIQIHQVNPGQTHPLLAAYFWFEAPDEPAAQRIIAILSKLSPVEAAYLGHQAEPPANNTQ